MRWLTFMILVAAALTLQSTVAPRLEIFGVRPDWLLVVVLFFGLYAPSGDAIFGGWIIGIAADLMTIERLGLLALSYALSALLVVAVRDYLFRDRAVTQFILALSVSLILRAAWMIFRRVLYGPSGASPWESSAEWVWASIYTAAWAPLLGAILLGRSHWFGISRRRYTYAGLHRIGRTGV